MKAALKRVKKLTRWKRWIRRCYTPTVSRVAHWLRLNRTLRGIYIRLNRPPGGVAHIEAGGHEASFHVPSLWELDMLDESEGFGGEKHILELLVGVLRAGDVVYDIGSSFGFYSILLAKSVGPKGVVFAFEPGVEAHRHLLENISLNGLTNVRPFRVAVGERSGMARLYLGNAEVDGTSSLVGPRSEVGNYQEVQVVVGDRFVEDEGLPVPRIVKIDVEGSEWAVVRGLRGTLARPGCELICCEVHPGLLPRGVTPEEVSDSIRSLGFTRIRVFERGTAEYHVVGSKG